MYFTQVTTSDLILLMEILLEHLALVIVMMKLVLTSSGIATHNLLKSQKVVVTTHELLRTAVKHLVWERNQTVKTLEVSLVTSGKRKSTAVGLLFKIGADKSAIPSLQMV